ncbi:MAG: hypothetical protein H0U95_10395 [Bacteroidetes bacterium]|nr:hypothetical protein [Bacteroidota bacterium]
MEIRLGTIKNEKTSPSIDLGEELSYEQHQTFLDSIKEIHDLESNKRLFEITFLNKNDFVDTFNRDVKDMISSSWILVGDRQKYYKHHLNFNRLFLNYLSSIKSFIDHNETHIKRKFGEISPEANEFKEITHYYFETFFCYRFFYKLRNYSQHCGLPLKDFNLSTKRNPDGSYIAKSEMTFDSNELLKNYNEWGSILKPELKKINGKFPLAPLVDEMTSVLIGFWQAVDTLNSKNVCKAAKFIKNNTDHLRAANTDICIFTNFEKNPDGSLVNFEKLIIPFDIIDDLDISGCA